MSTCVIVLIKDFDTAKTRLQGILGPVERRALAIENARAALVAARAMKEALAVCGSAEVAAFASALSVEPVLETEPRGQNAAAERGLAVVAERGAHLAALLLSSDLPLVDPEAVESMLDHASHLGDSSVLAAPALGRHGTNALFLRPVLGVDMKFGINSLDRFRSDALAAGRRFATHQDVRLALDVDEPSDVETWLELRAS